MRQNLNKLKGVHNMNTTKTRICDTALQLFNEKGYDKVSLREIAEAAGTTIGNLTYHFAQKEHLLEAATQRYQEDFFPQSKPFISGKEQLECIVLTFFKAQANEERASVYYKNVFEFSKNSPALEQRNKIFRKSLYDYYLDTFSSFRRDGIFRSEISADHINTLAYTIVFFTALWIQNASPYYDEDLPKIPLADALCNILQPYLAEDYVKEYQEMCIRQRNLKEYL